MCYNVEQLEEKILKRAKRDNPQLKLPFKPSARKLDHYVANGFTHPDLLVITSDEANLIQPLKWGLVPNWVKDEETAKKMSDFCLNAKSETIFEKPSFRTINKKRGLLPVNGFFEWTEFNGKKYPYFIYMKDQEPFYLGCLYDTWVDGNTGEIINSFSIITTEANSIMAKIHNVKKRMPFIVPYNQIEKWISPNLSKDEMNKMMKPFDERLMDAHTISKRITSRKDNPNVPEVTDFFSYPELEEK